MTDEELIAAHLAKKGATKVAPGEGVGLTNRQWYAGTQGRLDLKAKIRGERASFERTERQEERYMERAREAKHCGASDSEALDIARKGTAADARDWEGVDMGR